jgi:pyruvate formate lyase activating enzyme
VRASVIEYPGHIADVVYVGACNFRCPFCYNVDLVAHPQELPDIEPLQVLEDLQARSGFVDGLVVTGGEPTLQSDLDEFLTQVRQLDLAVKLDTNGSRPDVLQRCLEREVVDYVAMDIKSNIRKYHLAAGVTVDTELVMQSVQLVLGSQIDYEFRTTVVPGLVDLPDVESIVGLISGAKRYYLQRFRPGETLGYGPDASVSPPSVELLNRMADVAGHHVEEVGIRAAL